MKENSDSIVAVRRSGRMYMIPAEESSAQESSAPVGLQVTAHDNIEVGTGYDFLLGWKDDLNAGLIMANGKSIEDSDLAGHPILFQVDNNVTVSNEDAYQNSLNASAQASASYWGVNVSASVSALIERKASETNVSSFIQTLMGTKTCILVNYDKTKLTQTARELLLDDNGVMQKQANEERLLKFIACYGTHYVEGYSYGGSFNGSVTVQTSSTEDRKQVAAELKVSGAGQELGAAFSSAVTKVEKNHKVTVQVTSSGATGLVFTNNVQGLLAANDEFKIEVKKTGGIRVVAHLVPWGNAEPFRELVPVELISKYLGFGTMNSLLVEEARAYFTRLSYVKNCVYTLQQDYRPGGPWAFFVTVASDIGACLEALKDPLSRAEAALDEISLKDLSQKNYDPISPAFEELNKTMDAVEDKWKELQAAINKQMYGRMMRWILYDKKNNEEDFGKTLYSLGNPFEIRNSLGRNVGFQTLLLENDDGKRFYSTETLWTPMNDRDAGCYFGLGPDATFLSNTNLGEVVLATGIDFKDKNLNQGPYSLRAAWHIPK
jgi:hypothetical protein